MEVFADAERITMVLRKSFSCQLSCFMGITWEKGEGRKHHPSSSSSNSPSNIKTEEGSEIQHNSDALHPPHPTELCVGGCAMESPPIS